MNKKEELALEKSLKIALKPILKQDRNKDIDSVCIVAMRKDFNQASGVVFTRKEILGVRK